MAYARYSKFVTSTNKAELHPHRFKGKYRKKLRDNQQ